MILKRILIIVALALIFAGCSSKPHLYPSETIHTGEVQRLEFYPNKMYTAAVRRDTYYVWIDGIQHMTTSTDYEQLEVGMVIDYRLVTTSGILKIENIDTDVN